MEFGVDFRHAEKHILHGPHGLYGSQLSITYFRKRTCEVS